LAKRRQRSAAKKVALDEKAAKLALEALDSQRLKERAILALQASETARNAEKVAKDALEAYCQIPSRLLDAFTADTSDGKTSLTLGVLLKLATNDATPSEVRAECTKLILQRDDDARAQIMGLKRTNDDLSAKTAKGDAEIAKLTQRLADQADSFFGKASQESSSKKKPKGTPATAPALPKISVGTSTDAPSATAPALPKISVGTLPDASIGKPNEEKKVLQPRFLTRMSCTVQANSNARQELQKKADQLEEDITRADAASRQYKLTDISSEARRLRQDLVDMQAAFLKITLEIDAYEKGTAAMEHLVHCVQTSPDFYVIRTALINFTDLEKLVGTTTTLPASILAAARVKDPTPSEAANMKAPRPEQQVGASPATCNPKEPWSDMVARATLPQGIMTDNTRGVKVVFSIPSANAPPPDVVGCKTEGTFTKESGVPVTSIMRGFLTKMATSNPRLHNALVDCEIIKEGGDTVVGSPSNINWKLSACYVDRSGKLVIVACARK
jgi:hypothetical protein